MFETQHITAFKSENTTRYYFSVSSQYGPIGVIMVVNNITGEYSVKSNSGYGYTETPRPKNIGRYKFMKMFVHRFVN